MLDKIFEMWYNGEFRTRAPALGPQKLKVGETPTLLLQYQGFSLMRPVL